MSLFRQEALDSHGRKLFGEVVVRRAPSSWLILSTALLLTAACLAFVTNAELNRKVVVQGYLSPTAGIATVQSIRPGMIEKLFVTEGQEVKKGQPIAVIRFNETLVTGGLATEATQRELLASRKRLDNQLELSEAKSLSQAAQARARVGALRAQLVDLVRMRGVEVRRAAIADEETKGYEGLHARGFVSTFDMRRRESETLALQQAVFEVDQKISNVRSEIDEQVTVAQQIALDISNAQQEIGRQTTELNSQFNELSLSGGQMLVAPIDGTVATVQADIGSLVTVDRPVATLIPSGAILEARLYVPSESIGFIEPGQPATLLFSAYPYQNYGVGKGTVGSVSKMILPPDRVTGPLRLEVPTYRVSVKLAKTRLRAHGKDLVLTPGMTLTAEIVQSRRTIAGWLLEPLLAYRGRIA